MVSEFGINLASRMKIELPDDHVGCKEMSVYGVLSEMVFDAGDGHYLEIGTWRGASAIVAAKTKIEYKLGGDIYCVDHFKGFTGEFKQVNDIGQKPAEDNFNKYGVSHRIHIYNAPSIPLPIKDVQFECAFIDGDHWGKAPFKDFLEIKDRANQYILMDDYDDGHEDVQKAVNTIVLGHFGWKIKEIFNTCILFEKG